MQLVDDGSHLAALSGRFNRRSTTGHKGEQMYFGFFSASWINQIERFFALLSEKQIKRGVHRSTQHLERDIRAFIEANNAAPKPFRWTKSADDILASIRRFCLRSQQIGDIKESAH